MLIVLVSGRRDHLKDFEGALLEEGGVVVSHAGTGVSALQLVRSREPDLVVVDRDAPDFGPLELVSEILRTRALTQTAVVSPLNDAAFHEQSEGLGILKRLSDPPGREDARELLESLAMLQGV